ncbi:MAG: hypothetical protein CM15mP102_03690 [Flavobacteriales bacterium]|nr:MAG: hypothetical protein CM15mP102_03690 [Flavobacteriales bacterium]
MDGELFVIIYLLGARKGKFDSNGKAVAIPGSNIPLSAAGVLILWLGWFGFTVAQYYLLIQLILH